MLELRAAEHPFPIEGTITAERARTMARRGEIEGVGPTSGRIRYVRRLRESAVPPALKESLGAEMVYDSNSSAVARTNMGVYRQALKEPIVDEVVGHRFVRAEGETFAYCWAHCH